MKYVSMRRPDVGPFGETFLEARARAIVSAFFVNNPGGGCVETVVTSETQLFARRFATRFLPTPEPNLCRPTPDRPSYLAFCVPIHRRHVVRGSAMLLDLWHDLLFVFTAHLPIALSLDIATAERYALVILHLRSLSFRGAASP
jgi:hypothetical protein